jgi:hypothetical protein
MERIISISITRQRDKKVRRRQPARAHFKDATGTKLPAVMRICRISASSAAHNVKIPYFILVLILRARRRPIIDKHFFSHRKLLDF